MCDDPFSYMTDKSKVKTDQDKDMEKLYDINSDGYSVRCKLFANDPRQAEQVILLAHGFGGNKENKTFARFASHVLAKYKKVALIAYDCPCHGKDARKKLILQECENYLDIVIRDSKERFHTEDLCLYATSFGAYIALNYIAEHGSPFRRIALRSPAISMYESISERMLTEEDRNKLAKGKEVQIGYDRKMKIDQHFMDSLQEADVRKKDYIDFAEDMLIVHGTKDEVVACEPVAEFADQNIIELIAVENADHRFKDLNKLDLVHNQILRFFELG